MAHYLKEYPGLQYLLHEYHGACFDSYRWEADEFAEDMSKHTSIEQMDLYRSEVAYLFENDPDGFYEYFVSEVIPDAEESKEEVFALVNAIIENMVQEVQKNEKINKDRYPDMSECFRKHLVGHVGIETFFKDWPSAREVDFSAIASSEVEKFGIHQCQSVLQEGQDLIATDVVRLRNFLYEKVPGRGVWRDGNWEVQSRDTMEKRLLYYFEFLEQAIARAEKE